MPFVWKGNQFSSDSQLNYLSKHLFFCEKFVI